MDEYVKICCLIVQCNENAMVEITFNCACIVNFLVFISITHLKVCPEELYLMIKS